MNRPSRVNPAYCTPEKLREAARKRKLTYVSPLAPVPECLRKLSAKNQELVRAVIEKEMPGWKIV